MATRLHAPAGQADETSAAGTTTVQRLWPEHVPESKLPDVRWGQQSTLAYGANEAVATGRCL